MKQFAFIKYLTGRKNNECLFARRLGNADQCEKSVLTAQDYNLSA